MTVTIGMCPVCWAMVTTQGPPRGPRYLNPHPRNSVSGARCGGSLREVPPRPWWQR